MTTEKTEVVTQHRVNCTFPDLKGKIGLCTTSGISTPQFTTWHEAMSYVQGIEAALFTVQKCELDPEIMVTLLDQAQIVVTSIERATKTEKVVVRGGM